MGIRDSRPARVARRHQRAMAVAALVLGAATALAVVLILVDNIGHVVVALAGLALVGVGSWYAATSLWPRRWLALLAVGFGGFVVVWALGSAVEADVAIWRILGVAFGIAATTVCARTAVSSGSRTVFVRRQPPQRPVLVCNPVSGGGKVQRYGLVEKAESLGVQAVVLGQGDDLERIARDAVAGGADCLGMAGGDGSQAVVASVAVEAGLPFVCVAAGTRNHFALDLGLDRDHPASTLDAFTTGLSRSVDYATVESGGDIHFFVNNVSLGVYATVVQEDSYRDAKASTAFDLLPELLGSRTDPFDLSFVGLDGTPVNGAFLLLVSNNPYVYGPNADLGQRRALDTGHLGVFALSNTTGTDAAALAALSALGVQRRSPHWHEFATTGFEVDSRCGTAFAGMDGEAAELATPLRFRIHPGGLTLMVPSDNPESVRRRHARDVGLDDLLAVAGGAGPAGRQHLPEVR